MSNNENDESPHFHSRSGRIDGGLITGGIAAVAGWLGTSMFNSAKLIPFHREVAKRTRADILGRGGLAAGISESGAFNGASGMGNHIIEEAHRLAVIEEPGFGYAKRIMQMGGRSTVALFAGAIAGIVGLGAYFTFSKRQPDSEVVMSESLPSRPQASNDASTNAQKKNWQDTVQKDSAPTTARGA